MRSAFSIPVVLMILFLFAVVGTAQQTGEKPNPTENVCEGSTNGVDHLIFDDEGELQFISSRVLQKTENWLNYPCEPAHNLINDSLNRAKIEYGKRSRGSMNGWNCAFVRPRIGYTGRRFWVYQNLVEKGIYSNLIAIEVLEVNSGFWIEEQERIIRIALRLKVKPIKVVEGLTPPAEIVVYPDAQSIHGIRFCNRVVGLWNVPLNIRVGDQLFVLFDEFENSLIPTVSSPVFQLREGKLRGPNKFFSVVEEGMNFRRPTTVDEVISYLQASSGKK